MDLNKIKQKMAQLEKESQPREKIDYTEFIWKAPLGESNVRIVPSKKDPTYPFEEIKVHYGIAKHPMMALSNWGEQDPIEQFVAQLRTGSDKEEWRLSGKLQPKDRYYVPVIVRGEEEKGVRLWEFGKTIFTELVGIATDEDYGDYTDITNGFDFKVIKKKGDPYPETSIRPARKESPLSTKKKEVETWLSEQPDILEVYPKPDYEYVKTQLENWLSGKEDSQEDEEDTTVSTSATSTVAAPTAAPTSITNKFDDLFPED